MFYWVNFWEYLFSNAYSNILNCIIIKVEKINNMSSQNIHNFMHIFLTLVCFFLMSV